MGHEVYLECLMTNEAPISGLSIIPIESVSIYNHKVHPETVTVYLDHDSKRFEIQGGHKMQQITWDVAMGNIKKLYPGWESY